MAIFTPMNWRSWSFRCEYIIILVLSSFAAQANVQGALTTMARVRSTTAYHMLTKARALKPQWHSSAQYTSLGTFSSAFAGNYKYMPKPIGTAAVHKISQHFMRFRLVHPMQVQPCLYCHTPRCQAPQFTVLKIRQRLWPGILLMWQFGNRCDRGLALRWLGFCTVGCPSMVSLGKRGNGFGDRLPQGGFISGYVTPVVAHIPAARQ
jgi:hypothetical protein